MNSLIQVFQLVGSLGLFIYGMVLMSESIQRLAGKRLRSAVSTVTRNPARAYMSGLSLTGLLQSSSVTSLMAVSFVQVGLLRLSEAYFVLLGANLGTTVTGWLVALTISKPSIGSFALPILACALPLLFAQRRRTRSAGEAVIGFALMFVGLGLLKDGVPPITEAGLAQFLAQFSGGGIGGALGIGRTAKGAGLSLLPWTPSQCWARARAVVSSGAGRRDTLQLLRRGRTGGTVGRRSRRRRRWGVGVAVRRGVGELGGTLPPMAGP